MIRWFFRLLLSVGFCALVITLLVWLKHAKEIDQRIQWFLVPVCIVSGGLFWATLDKCLGDKD